MKSFLENYYYYHIPDFYCVHFIFTINVQKSFRPKFFESLTVTGRTFHNFGTTDEKPRSSYLTVLWFFLEQEIVFSRFFTG